MLSWLTGCGQCRLEGQVPGSPSGKPPATPVPARPQLTPSSSYLSNAVKETLPAPHGPRWVCEVGAGLASAAGELDHDSLPMPRFSGASTPP